MVYDRQSKAEFNFLAHHVSLPLGLNTHRPRSPRHIASGSACVSTKIHDPQSLAPAQAHQQDQFSASEYVLG
jgi:hypothetical protein